MPGRAPRSDRQRLTAAQSRLARTLLKKHFDVTAGMSQWSTERKVELVAMVNQSFGAAGETTSYSVRKLEDWTNNAQYRISVKNRAKKPESWTLDSRTQARLKARSKRASQHKTSRANTAACQQQRAQMRHVHAKLEPLCDALRHEFERRGLRAHADRFTYPLAQHASQLAWSLNEMPQAQTPFSELQRLYIKPEASEARRAAAPQPAFARQPFERTGAEEAPQTFAEVREMFERYNFGRADNVSHRGEDFLASARHEYGRAWVDPTELSGAFEPAQRNADRALQNSMVSTEHGVQATFLALPDFQPVRRASPTPPPPPELPAASAVSLGGLGSGLDELDGLDDVAWGECGLSLPLSPSLLPRGDEETQHMAECLSPRLLANSLNSLDTQEEQDALFLDGASLPGLEEMTALGEDAGGGCDWDDAASASSDGACSDAWSEFSDPRSWDTADWGAEKLGASQPRFEHVDFDVRFEDQSQDQPQHARACPPWGDDAHVRTLEQEVQLLPPMLDFNDEMDMGIEAGAQQWGPTAAAQGTLLMAH